MLTPKFSVLVTLVSLALQAYAIPMGLPSDMPIEARTLSLDERSGNLIAFDSSGRQIRSWNELDTESLDRRQDNTKCRPLTVDELRKLPGWEKLKAAAEKEWGNRAYELVTNPEQYRDRPATVCAQSDPVMIRAEKPSCQTNEADLGGSLTNTEGKAAIEIQTGTDYELSTTTTSEASLSIGMSSTVSVGIPEVAGASATFSMSTTITNSLGKTSTQKQSNQVKSTVEIGNKAGQTCSLKVKTTTCTTKGTGRMRYTADGFAWFNYHDRTKGSYKWAMRISMLSVDERSNYLEFESMINTNTKAKYAGQCAGGSDSAKAAAKGRPSARPPVAQGKGTPSKGTPGLLPPRRGSPPTKAPINVKPPVLQRKP